jgi:protein-tyrosine-phosphatase
MSLDARLALKDVGLDLDENTFRSKDLKRHPEAVLGANLILTMTHEQKRMLSETFQSLDPNKVHTWLGFVNEPGDVEDPCGKGPEGAMACLETLQRTLPPMIKGLLGLAL